MRIVVMVAICLAVQGCKRKHGEVRIGEQGDSIANLYQGKVINNLKNWSNTELVDAEAVAETKNEIMVALRVVGFNILPELPSEQLQVTYRPDNAVISIYSSAEHCQGEERGSCFYLQIRPAPGNTFEVVVVRLPAYENLGKIVASHSTESASEELLETLLEVMPHDLQTDQVKVDSFGVGKHLTFTITTDEGQKRELHIDTLNGAIDNTQNNRHGYRVYSDEFRL